jgi:hypothetical protein
VVQAIGVAGKGFYKEGSTGATEQIDRIWSLFEELWVSWVSGFW